MIRIVIALVAASLIAGGSAWAQTTSSNGIRSGYGAPAGSPTSTTPTTSTSTTSSGTRNVGTGQGRTEGAMGLTPQLQKELGIRRQQ